MTSIKGKNYDTKLCPSRTPNPRWEWAGLKPEIPSPLARQSFTSRKELIQYPKGGHNLRMPVFGKYANKK